MIRRFTSTLFCSFLVAISFSQTWTQMKNKCPFNANTPMLLKDGTIFFQDADNSNWWKLTPDITGNYVNGTWTQLASTPGYGPLYYASQVLPDGRVFTMGGEYNFGNGVWQNQGFIYNPVKNTWAAQAAPTGWSQMGDTGSVVLGNGKVLLQDPLSSQGALFDPVNNSFIVPYGVGKADGNDEEGLTLLPNGNILVVDAAAHPNSEIFNTTTATWSSAGNTPLLLADPSTYEVGPQVLRPDGTVICFGAIGHNCIFNSTSSTWSAAPDFPKLGGVQLDCEDAPATLLTSGNVLVQTSPGVFTPPSVYFEWNGVSYTQVPAPADSGGQPSFTGTFLMLPTGQVLHTDQNSDVEIYTSSGQPNKSWAPTITNYPNAVKAGFGYVIYGQQFTGLSGNSAYGDDVQNPTNYPIIRITNNTTGHVFYCREYSPSTTAICTGSTIVSTDFLVPSNAELGASKLQVIANGIASAPVSVTVYPAVQASAVSVFRGTNGTGTVSDVWTIDGLVYSCGSVQTSAGQEAVIEADFNFPSSNIAGLSVVSSIAVNGSSGQAPRSGSPPPGSGATGMLYVYDWQAQQFVYLSSNPVGTTQTIISGSATAPFSRFVSPTTGEVRVLVRAVVPNHVSPATFKLSADLIEVQPS